MIPKINIQYLNGQLGIQQTPEDGLLALIVGATAVSTTFALNKPYVLTSADDLTTLGITSVNNATLYKHVTEFYGEAPAGTKFIIYGVADTSTMEDVLDDTDDTAGTARHLLASQNGAIRGLLVGGLAKPSGSDSDDGIDSGVIDAVADAQALAEWATTTMYAPIFVILEGQGYDASKTLKSFALNTTNRVAILLGDTTSGSDGAALGVLGGRLSQCTVQRNIGRVADGALKTEHFYIGTTDAGSADTVIADAYDKGYIVPRTYTGRSGYFFTDDNMACKPTDDYSHLTARRTVDKAYRIAYDALLDVLIGELPIEEDGTIQRAVVASWEEMVLSALNRNMTANGELSTVNGDGAKVFIDPNQNVVSTSRLGVSIAVRPFGYARYINVQLGFTATN